MHNIQNMDKLEEAKIPNFYMDHNMITNFVTRLAGDGRPMNDYKDQALMLPPPPPPI